MKRILNFSGFIFESNGSPQTIADLIQKSAGGIGTDEELLVATILQIKDQKTLVEVNKILKENPKYSYRSIEDTIKGELGFFDDTSKKIIQSHIKGLKGKTPALTPQKPQSELKDLDIIKEIIPRVKKHEGVKPKKYLDSRNIPTVGIGLNLNRKDAAEKLKAVGANPIKVKNGTQALSEEQMEKLLISDLKASKKSVEKIVGNLSSHPAGVQGVLIEMAFNLGASGLSKFEKFLKNVKDKNYKEASREMLNSTWSKQVGNRSKTLSEIVAKS
jgi:lysozyme